MQVQRISNNSYNTNIDVKYNNVEHKKELLQKGNNTNFVSPNAYYNQMSFKGGSVGNTMPEIINFMKETIEPFIKETDPLFDKAFNLSEKIGYTVREFVSEKIKFNPLEFREVKRLRLDELHNNKQEYYYLLKKSDNYYCSKETSDYALGLFDYFSAPAFLRDEYNAFYKMKKDTEHGLQNINLEKLYPELAKKKYDIGMVGSNAGMGMSGYTHAYHMNKRFNEMLENGVINIAEYKKTALEAERGMEQHKKYLPEIEEAIKKAENLDKNGLFTEEDYDLLNGIPKRGRQVISRNAKKFNDIASKTELSENESKQLDDILKKQKELIEDLWNKIEVDKKAYFEREAKAKAEWEAQARAEEERLRTEFGGDLPPFYF